MDCPNGCNVPMKQIKVERIFYRKNGEPIVIRALTMNVCTECGQESMPLKSARMVEDILNGKVKPVGQFTAVMYRAAQGNVRLSKTFIEEVK